MNEATEAIIGVARAVHHGRLPPAIVAHVKRLLLDGISWMVMGARKEEAQDLLRSLAGQDAGNPLTVIGTDRKADLRDAIFLNACFAQVHDCNDVRRLARRDGGSNHPGRGVVPAALSIAEHYRMSGVELLELLVVGYEVASRVATQRSNHQYSAAIAAMMGRALRMPDAEFRRAILLAHLGFPLYGDWADGSDFDFLKNGLIAAAALDGVLLASANLTLPSAAVDLRVATPLPADLPSGPEAFAIADISIKPYPCCRSLHGALDLALELRTRSVGEASQIESVEVRVGNTQQQLFEPVMPDAHYKRCQFSIPYTTACAFLDGRVGEDTFSRQRIAAADVQELQKKIRVVHDERLVYNPNGAAKYMRPTILTMVTTGGEAVSRATMTPRGSRLNPLSEEELHEKFCRWTGETFSPARKAEIVAAVRSVEDIADVASLVSLLGRSPDRS